VRVLENTKIGVKIAAMMAVLGAICIGVAVYGGHQLKTIDSAYSVLTDVRGPARVKMARANRAANQMGFYASMTVF
jgi:hypothetical protein